VPEDVQDEDVICVENYSWRIMHRVGHGFIFPDLIQSINLWIQSNLIHI